MEKKKKNRKWKTKDKYRQEIEENFWLVADREMLSEQKATETLTERVSQSVIL